MSPRDEVLFSQHSLDDVLRAQEQTMFKEIDSIEGNRLLNTSVDDLCDYFEQRFKIEAPKLREDEITVDQNEVQVDVRHDRRRDIFDRSRPFYLKGTSVSFFVPFDGEEDCFKFQPSTRVVGPPSGLVRGRELVLTYTRLDHDAAAVRSQFERELAEIRSNLEWMTRDLAPFNNSIREKAKNRINARREKLLKDEGLAAGLGYRLRPRQDAPQTYVAPSVRRKTIPSQPPASAARFVPEPILDMREYEHILSVMANMVAVMERSPKAFRGMEEEDLRQHFLVQLNGQFEGQATGETFNFEGKTDILIRVDGKNIFIAECMFWHGPESLKKKIDQLLGYTSWRDTKVAILIFNREKNFSAVVSKIPEVVESHPNFKRRLPYTSETGSRIILHHRDDKNRELTLTVLAFEVPA